MFRETYRKCENGGSTSKLYGRTSSSSASSSRTQTDAAELSYYITADPCCLDRSLFQTPGTHSPALLPLRLFCWRDLAVERTFVASQTSSVLRGSIVEVCIPVARCWSCLVCLFGYFPYCFLEEVVGSFLSFRPFRKRLPGVVRQKPYNPTNRPCCMCCCW